MITFLVGVGVMATGDDRIINVIYISSKEKKKIFRVKAELNKENR